MTEQTKWYAPYSKDLEQRRNWYSNVAKAYDQARPRYPKELICRAVELAQLPADAIILEVGCGPGTATVEFAQLGFRVVCLEPSQSACFLARQNCSQYPAVEIKNTTFEEWQLETEKFNAVIAANSFHWIAAEIRNPKAAAALQNNGSLILLWNKEPQPPYEVYQALNQVYQAQAPSLARYEDRETQSEILKGLGENMINSDLFKGIVYEQVACEVTYSIDEYLMLLSTLSPYIALEPQKRNSLFDGLREVLERNCFISFQCSYISGFHIGQKVYSFPS